MLMGVNFEGLRDAGDPVELARRYNEAGADELTFLDVTASSSDRETTYEVVRQTAEEVFIPLTVGGGVRAVEDVDRLLRNGADKASINTAAVTRPEVINEITQRFGSQVLVLSVDARRTTDPSIASGYEVTTHGGRTGTGMCAVAWAKDAAERGVGEILLNSIDADGTKDGFDLEMIRSCRSIGTPDRFWWRWKARGFPTCDRSWRRCRPCGFYLPLWSERHDCSSEASNPRCWLSSSLVLEQ